MVGQPPPTSPASSARVAAAAISSTGWRTEVSGGVVHVAMRLSSKPMTSVRQPVEEMAATATRALLAGEVATGWHPTFQTTLTVRDSSG